MYTLCEVSRLDWHERDSHDKSNDGAVSGLAGCPRGVSTRLGRGPTLEAFAPAIPGAFDSAPRTGADPLF